MTPLARALLFRRWLRRATIGGPGDAARVRALLDMKNRALDRLTDEEAQQYLECVRDENLDRLARAIEEWGG